jgi:hypothetical protein
MSHSNKIESIRDKLDLERREKKKAKPQHRPRSNLAVSIKARLINLLLFIMEQDLHPSP